MSDRGYKEDELYLTWPQVALRIVGYALICGASIAYTVHWCRINEIKWW